MNKLRSLILMCSIACAFALGVAAQAPASHWAKYDNGKVHYYDIGKRDKQAIVFIHGWTCNADFWKDSYSAFPEYRVIAIDLPGHGKSDKPQANYTMEYFARSIEAVMKAANVKRAVIVGHSMGAPVIIQFYRNFPKQTLALVSVDGALGPLGPKAELDKFFAPLFADYKTQSVVFVDNMLKPTRADLRPYIRSAMLSTPDYVGTSAMRGMLDEGIYSRDPIKVPVLAVMAESPHWPKDLEAQYKTIAPDLEFQMWTGVSHFLMMEKPAEFNAAIRSFVKREKCFDTPLAS